MLTDLLQHYDFSEKEAKVYLTSLEFGKSPASSLARKSGIKRVTTYALLKEMEKKGFIIHEEVAGIIYFSAVHPETLLRHFQEQSQQFEQALPELLALANSFSDTKGEIKLETHRRDPLHSQGLQEKFPQMYQDFWKGNEHIFSGNSVLTR
ncbi:hypothetical protein FACS189428_3820 [Clostridia bacterium]|nr:hypothetical protein FACS189428_3820 [Clostridia bacterium]